MATQVQFQDLLSTGAHFGHVTSKWHPNFKPYILMEKNGVYIINLEETIAAIEKAQEFIRQVISKKGEVLFVGTKKQARDIVQQEADRCRMFYVVERWFGGTLTNFSTIKKSIKRLQLLEKEGSSIYENLTKKEIQQLNRERIRLSDQHRGIKDMRRLPDVLVVVDAHFESTAVKEAKRLEIPVIALVDTNTDPTPIDYPIPANDDSLRTIQIIMAAMADAVLDVRNANKEKETVATEKTESVSKVKKPTPAKRSNAKSVESDSKKIVTKETGVEEKPAEIKTIGAEPEKTPEPLEKTKKVATESTIEEKTGK
ncbi:MAG: 30S ribosomal protein S2 [FCB group bacterium]|nr:30S ribosomal protein S2 [FCB group bacterium]